MSPLDLLLAEGVSTGVFPLARAVVWQRGRQVFSGGNASADTLFDCASVTKVLSTTAVYLQLHNQQALRREQTLGSLLPNARLDEVTLEDLLYHRSGLEPFRCAFEPVMNAHPALFEADCPRAERAAARAQLVALTLEAAPTRARRREAVYSDLGFILLGEALAAAAGAPLDELFSHHVAAPLGLECEYRRLSAGLPPEPRIAPTGVTRPREPAPGQQGLWTIAARPGRAGEVDDDNAWCLDGVSGHAGVFSTAEDLARFGQAVLDGRLAPPSPWAADASTPGSTRALGFDTPSAEGASCGPRFGRLGPRGAIGHLGFTGMSLWLELDRALVVVLATNRVALGRANVRIRDFRPRFHDAVLDEVT